MKPDDLKQIMDDHQKEKRMGARLAIESYENSVGIRLCKALLRGSS